MNTTLTTFGYPDTLIEEYDHWVVLLRPAQATLGALVIGCKEAAERLSAVTRAALLQMPQVLADADSALRAAFECDKVNFMMLMMVDPHVHYHVLPRYAGPREVPLPALQGTTFEDPGWPALPRLDYSTSIQPAQSVALIALLRTHWPDRRP